MPALPTAMVQLYAVIGTAALVVAGMSVLRRRRASWERDVQRLETVVRLLRAARELREELDLREEGS
jgi:hypothetical protein